MPPHVLPAWAGETTPSWVGVRCDDFASCGVRLGSDLQDVGGNVCVLPCTRPAHSCVRSCVQVDLAANATDNELRVQADRHAAAKAEVDPIRAVTSMAAVLGGKFFLLQVRLAPATAPRGRPLAVPVATTTAFFLTEPVLQPLLLLPGRCAGLSGRNLYVRTKISGGQDAVRKPATACMYTRGLARRLPLPHHTVLRMYLSRRGAGCAVSCVCEYEWHLHDALAICVTLACQR